MRPLAQRLSERLVFPAVLLLVAAVAASGALTLRVVRHNETHVAALYARSLAEARDVEHLDALSERLARLVRSYLLLPDPAVLESLVRSREELARTLARLERTAQDPAVSRVAGEVAHAQAEVARAADALIARRREGLPLLSIQGRLARELNPARARFDASLARLRPLTEARLAAERGEAERLLARSQRLFLVSLAAGLSALVALTALLVRALRSRSQSHEEAERRAAELGGVLDGIPEAVFVVEPGRVRATNARGRELLGLREGAPLPAPQDAAAGLRVRAPEGGPPLTLEQTGVMEALAGRQVLRELVAELPQGDERFLRVAAAPVQKEGRTVAMVAVISDLTERRARERAVALSEAKFSSIVALAADGIVSVDAGQRITVFNRGAEALFGYRAGEVLGQPLDVLLPERARAAHREHVRAFAAQATPSRRMGGRQELRGRRKDGSEFPLEAAISRTEVNGEVLMTVVLRDVTAQRREERAQRLLTDVSAALAESLDPAALPGRLVRLLVPAWVDRGALYLTEDGASVQLVALAAARPGEEEALVAAWGGRTVPLGRDTGLGRVVSTGRAERLEGLPRTFFPFPMPPLDVRALLALPLRARGRIAGALVVTVGPSGRDLDAADLALGEEVARRAALALDNARLYAEAQRATRARDEVLGVVAHDLRSPLNAIVLSARALEGDPARARTVERVLGATQRMDRLIQDLLDVVRTDAGTLTLERAPVGAGALVDEALEAARPQAASAGLALDADVRAGAGEVVADRDRVLQIFGNLMGNALKFTPEGGRVTVGAERCGAGEVLFWVADDGPGLAPDQLPHLFERFWQARPADRRGAGLGLAIAKGLVEAHGGRIWAESAPGRGTRVLFTLPAAAPLAAEAARPEAG